MKLMLNTSQFNYRGGDRVDTTVKSSAGTIGAVLAPTWEMVAGVKKFLNPVEERWIATQLFTPEEYNRAYLKLVRKRFAANEQPFIDLFEFAKLHGSLTLVCYCPDGQFCHRHTALEEVMFPLAEHYGYEPVRGSIR